MTTFSHFAAVERRAIKTVVEATRRGLYQYDPVEGKISAPDRMAALAGTAGICELLVIGKLFAYGPKVLLPDRRDLEVLEHVDINLTLDDYVQPFETVCIEFPDEYQARKVLDPETGGQHSVCLVMLWRGPDCVIANVMFSDLESSVKIVLRGEGTLEWMINHYEKTNDFGTLRQSDDEAEIVKNALRAAMNFCLLVDEVGSRQTPDSSHVARLKRRASRGLSQARKELAEQPTYFELRQRVALCSRPDRAEVECDGGEGGKKRPHHRRGHYRMQVYGVGRSERKRIRVPPVFVNAHLFLGDLADSQIEYSINH